MSSKIYIIAEIGNNHNGCVSKAKKLIDVAKEAGVDAVKFQSFRGKDIVATNVMVSDYPSWDNGKFKFWHEFLDSIALPLNSHQELINYAMSNGLDFITTPVSPKIIEFLEDLSDIKSYKIASMDLTNIDLLYALSKTKKELILSTGMGSLDEVKKAYNIIKSNKLSILHCISDYPLNPENANLSNIKFLTDTFPDVRIGFSDHSLGHELSLLAINCGARVIEKHITLDRNDKQKAEHHFSLEPLELKCLVKWIRIQEKIINQHSWLRSQNEKKLTTLYRRSFRYNKDLKKNQTLSIDDIVFIRPGDGVGMEDRDKIIGKKLKMNRKKNQPCLLKDVE